MPLKLYPRPNGIYHIRGTVQGERYDVSARTRVKAEAEQIRAKLETEAFHRSVYGAKAVATFSEAAIGYMKAGGEAEHLTPLLAKLGNRKLSDINQMVVDEIAGERAVKPSTLVRQVYTPILAVLNFGAENGLCAKPAIRKPKIKATRTEYLTPAEADAWIGALAPYLAQLVTFYLGTGCRASEALGLDWKDVSPKAERVVLWDTKGGYARAIELPRRVRDNLPERRDGPVFLNSKGEPWHSYDAINLMLKRYRERLGKADKPVALAPLHCHLLRHTWATWAYACTRDLTFLMQQGGWRSLSILGRYTHAGSPDLAQEILGAGWEFQGREIHHPKRKPRKLLKNNGKPP
jgi:integrase